MGKTEDDADTEEATPPPRRRNAGRNASATPLDDGSGLQRRPGRRLL